jgi:2-methyl-3-hydroxypyridine 5-carboxylic acid dioxygenase
MSGKRHAEIAGAGFAGLVAGVGLAQRGWSVRVHEAAAELRAFGAGIFIWENGMRVLAAIGAYDAVMAGAHEAGVYETRRGGRVIAAQPFEAGLNCRMLTMTRQHLYAAILDCARKAGVECLTNSQVVGATPDGVLTTADGQHWSADLVVGADGVKSKVRESLKLPTERSSCADGIIRLLGPRCRAELGPGDWDHVIDFWSGAAGGLRILYVPCNEQQLYLAMMAPVGDREASATPIRRDLWIAAFPQLEPVLRNIIADGRYDAYETTRIPRWSVGRVAVIGDAAHAMVPTLGQGAGTAMMNALSLAVSVEQAPEMEVALEVWERRERPLTQHTQDRSEQVARERLMYTGQAWDADSLRTASCVPTGTEHLPHCLDRQDGGVS